MQIKGYQKSKTKFIVRVECVYYIYIYIYIFLWANLKSLNYFFNILVSTLLYHQVLNSVRKSKLKEPASFL